MGEGLRRRTFLLGSAAGVGALASGGVDAAAEVDGAGDPVVARTTVEAAPTLLGTDVASPRLSWVVGGGGVRQTAYQVRVDGVWDSGKVASGQTVGVPYGGPPLAPHRV